MKKSLILLLFISVYSLKVVAQQEKGIYGSSNWLLNWTSFKPNNNDYNDNSKVADNLISINTTWVNTETYLLDGKVYVTGNATLTIQPGTIIRCSSESALIITKGSKLIAEGTGNSPIVFTSSKPIKEKKPGDWGGIVIMGDAPINYLSTTCNLDNDIKQEFKQYGGSNAPHNGGALKYVRIEYAGRASEGYQRFRGLTFAGVGSQTKADFIQITNCLGGSFMILGGGFSANNLFSYKCRNNDFEITLGSQFNLNNSIAIRNIQSSNNNESHAVGLKVSSFLKKEMSDFNKKLTNVVATNITIVNEIEKPESNELTLLKEGVKIMPYCSLTLKSSIICGFAPAVLLDTGIDFKEFKNINIEKGFFNNCNKYVISENGGSMDGELEEKYANKDNVQETLSFENLFIEPKNEKTPDYRVQIAKIR